MFGLDPFIFFLLILCIFCACAFEFVNGCHDTANAVATVIYTNTLKPMVAVFWSGAWNFLGVIRGGIDVAMGIILLLPLEALVNQSPYFSIAMVMALLLSSIIWNLTTWYLGIPCSSSHTLIGAIIGVGLAFGFMPENTSHVTVNWHKGYDIGISLLCSPLIGFGATFTLMMLMMRFIKNKQLFETQHEGNKPPFWIRAILVGTCTAVSYAHGNNDGQKGVGLIMLILIAMAPLHFALNPNQDFRKMAIDANDLSILTHKLDSNRFDPQEKIEFHKFNLNISSLQNILSSVTTSENLSKENKLVVRSTINSISKEYSFLDKTGKLSWNTEQKEIAKAKISAIKPLTDYAPLWVIGLVSISLGLGTMVGWKRIVTTIGEKIGKSHLTYAQGASAELVAASTIYVASTFGLPVSTTQVLTSAVAGGMVANDGIKNLQMKTLRSIAIAWVLTLPVCIVLAGGLFWLFRLMIS